MKLKVYTESANCQKLWETFWPGKVLFDLWQIRACFRDEFQRPLRFQTVESNGQAVPGPLHLGYLSQTPLLETLEQAEEDEKGYHFYPGIYDDTFENYWLDFSSKSRKKIKKEITALETAAVSCWDPTCISVRCADSLTGLMRKRSSFLMIGL